MHKEGKMLTLDKIRELLADRRLDVVSQETKIHRNTLSGIRSGAITDPRYSTLAKLSDYLTRGAE
jgi:hypothetical protein